MLRDRKKSQRPVLELEMIIYIIDLAPYDQFSLERPTQTSLMEQLNLFNLIVIYLRVNSNRTDS